MRGGNLRISPTYYNDTSEIDRLVEALPSDGRAARADLSEREECDDDVAYDAPPGAGPGRERVGGGFQRRPRRRRAEEGGTLRYGTVSEIVSLDPHVYGGNAWKVLIEALYSPLVGYDKTGAVVPRLAQSWEQPDARSIVFHLRAGAKFHDGTPVTADDVKFSLDRILDPAAGAALEPAGRHGDGGRRGHRQGRKPSPDATLLAVLAMPEAAIVSRKWVESGANLKLSANGTGPFVLKSYEPAVRASLVRNPAYFVDAQPYLDGVDFRMIKSDDARVNALRSQSLDMIDFVPWKDIDALRRNAGMKVDMAGGAFMSVWFNTAKKPFDDARVRRAVSYAIDREAVSKAAFFGHGQPIYGAPTTADSPYYNKDLDGTYKRDLARARAAGRGRPPQRRGRQHGGVPGPGHLHHDGAGDPGQPQGSRHQPEAGAGGMGHAGRAQEPRRL